MDPLVGLGLFGVAFFGTHVGLTHPPVRTPLVERLGRNGWWALYSLVSIATWLPLVGLWWMNPDLEPLLFSTSATTTRAAEIVAAVGLAAIGAGLGHVVPASLVGAVREPRPLEVQGMAHVTRHPVMVGTALLSIAHLIGNGWAGQWVFWGTHLLVALAVVHQDMRLKAERPGYAEFCTRTSVLPDPRGLPRIGLRATLSGGAGLGLAAALRWLH